MVKLWFCALVLGFSFGADAAFTVPPLREPVQDEVGIFSRQEKQELSSLIRSASESGKIQLQILIIPSLQGEPIESATIKIAEAWKLGTAKGDQGVLFLIAINDRRMRIEVGQGLEGDIPDVLTKRIQDDQVAPLFRKGDMAGGIRAGAIQLLSLAGAENLPVDGPPQKSGSGRGKIESVGQIILYVILMLFVLFSQGFRRRRGRAGLLGGTYIGGGGGGGWGGGGGFGGGGGGWSGGGGGFSGGGSSSGW